MSGAVLVTGGAGFIGRNLVAELGERWQVLAPTHGELELLDQERVQAYLAAHAVDVVVHCAVRPGHRHAVDPSGQLERNLRMFANLARCRGRYRRLIFVSSGAVYGGHERARLPESAFGEHVPADEHGLSKYLCAAYAATRPDMVELRPFGVFGPYEDYAIRFISNAICKTLYDLPVTLRQDRLFDYTPVRHLACVIERFFTHDPAHHAYNVSATEPVHLLDLARLVVRLSGKDVPVVVANEGMGAQYSGDGRRLRIELPDLVPPSVEQAVAELYDWYTQRRAAIDRSLLLVDP